MRLHGMEVVPLIDGEIRVSVEDVVGKGSDRADWDEVLPGHVADDGMMTVPLGGFLVRGIGDRIVLIDAGVGPITRERFTGGRLLERLAEEGVKPSDVTDVIFTHLHFDHVGWASQQGRVVFDRAAYRCDERDWHHFVDHDPGATRKLLPLATHLETFDGSGTILPGIDLQAAPGHTPGSTVIVLSSGTDRVVLLGDAVHCPIELVDDEWGTIGDVDPALAKRTKAALAQELEGSTAHVSAAHFPEMQFGRLLQAQAKRQWVVE
jgi:glyoxylase-like metal-dependent hydrolase (beta-lactamase superfamily II)